MDKRLYVIVRDELASMTTGRIAAQVSHASTKAMQDIQNGEFGENASEMFSEWLAEANGFGTTIVLKPSTRSNQQSEFENIYQLAKANELCSDMIVDPEYYIMDGTFPVRLENVLTCMYIFGETDTIKTIVGNLDLL